MTATATVHGAVDARARMRDNFVHSCARSNTSVRACGRIGVACARTRGVSNRIYGDTVARAIAFASAIPVTMTTTAMMMRGVAMGGDARRRAVASSVASRSRSRVVVRADRDHHQHHHRGVMAISVALTTMMSLATPSAHAIDMVVVDKSVTEYMRSRDEAASWKCANMFDCNNDRREYAQKQSENLAARLATAAKGEKVEPTCSIEDPCTDNVLRAALVGVQGLTTQEKLEKMNKPVDVANASSQYFDF